MIKHNSNILRVPTDFENVGWKEISTLREIFLTSCLEKVGSVIRMLGRVGQWRYKKPSMVRILRIAMGMRIIKNPLSFKMNFMTLEIQWISHVIHLTTGGDWRVRVGGNRVERRRIIIKPLSSSSTFQAGEEKTNRSWVGRTRITSPSLFLSSVG